MNGKTVGTVIRFFRLVKFLSVDWLLAIFEELLFTKKPDKKGLEIQICLYAAGATVVGAVCPAPV